MTKASDNEYPSVLLDEQASAPTTPATGFWRVYAKSDGLYIVDDAGTETGPFGTGGAGGSGELVQLAQTVVGAGGATTITLDPSSGTKENLRIVLQGRGTAAAATVGVAMQFNNDTGSNYDWQRGFASNGSALVSGSESIGGTSARGGGLPGGNATADVAGLCEIIIPGYSRSVFDKVAISQTGYFTGAGEYGVEHSHSHWNNTAAITEIDLMCSSGDFAEGTVATLYEY